MLYAIASGNWAPGDPLTPAMARGGLSRWRPKTEEVATGGPTLAVALRYDETRGQVVAEGATVRGSTGPWSAPAIVDSVGGVLVLAAIPAALVRVIGKAEIRVHEADGPAIPRAHVSIGPPAPTGRVRVVDGRALPPHPQQARLLAFGKPESRTGPPRSAGGTPRTRGVARPESREPVREGTGTASAFRNEVDILRSSRPPPHVKRAGLLPRVVPAHWKGEKAR